MNELKLNKDTTKKEKKVITELTEEQKAKCPAYVEKWTKKGLYSAPTTVSDRKKSESAIIQLYKQAGLKPPKFYWTSNPIAGAKKCIELGDTSKSDIQWEASYGSHEAAWLAFYDFMRTELGLIEETEEIMPFFVLGDHCGWWWPYEEVCVCSERPLETHVNERGDFHNYFGPSIKYKGFEMYHFNGIEVPKELAMKKAKQITKQDFLGQENADIRREISSKIGIERTMEILGAEVTEVRPVSIGGQTQRYELVDVDFDSRGTKRPYLKMANPSIKANHIEGVRPGTKTVEEALCYRNGLKKWVSPANLS